MNHSERKKEEEEEDSNFTSFQIILTNGIALFTLAAPDNPTMLTPKQHHLWPQS